MNKSLQKDMEEPGPKGHALMVSGSKQRPEAFLLEMPVTGEHICQTLLAHDLHGYAIGKAIGLVQAGAIKLKPIQKNVWGMHRDPDCPV